MIKDNVKIKCPNCFKIRALRDWNRNTFSRCTTNEMKASYLRLNSEKAFTKAGDAYYCCPECERLIKGCQLIIESNDPRLVRLGRQPLYEIKLKYDNPDDNS